MVLENGDVAKVTREELAPGGQVDVGRVATWRGHPLGSSVLAERRSLGRGGALSLSVALDAKGRLAAPPSMSPEGLSTARGNPGNLRFIALEVSRAIQRSRSADDVGLADIIRIAASRAVEDKTGRKPLCLATVIRV